MLLVFLSAHTSQLLQTSTHPAHPAIWNSSSHVIGIAEFADPHAGKTVSNRCNEMSACTAQPSGSANGQTPPTSCPVDAATEGASNILGFMPNCARNLRLSIRASPAATTRMHPVGAAKVSVLAILAPSTPRASAARGTVALDTENSMIRDSRPNGLRNSRTRTMDDMNGYLPFPVSLSYCTTCWPRMAHVGCLKECHR